MVSIDYVKKETSRFKRTNTSTLYKDKTSVYKIIERYTWLYYEIINNILYNYSINQQVNPRIILPNELIIDNNGTDIRGYKCNYVNGKDLENLAKDLSIEEKIKLLNDLTSLLKEINSYLIVGDLNLGNCMYDKNLNGYLIDFDLSSKLDEEPTLMSYYNFTSDKKKDIRSNLSTDKLKMAIIVASVLYNINFEDSFVSSKSYSAWDKYLQYTNNTFFKDFFKTNLHNIEKGKKVDDYLVLPQSKSFEKMIEEDKKIIRKLVK